LRARRPAPGRPAPDRFSDPHAATAYALRTGPYGGSLQGPQLEAGPLAAMYQDITGAIREVDTDSWLCIEPQAMGINWGTATGLRAIDDPRAGDPRIAYCPHLYPLPMDLGAGYNGTTGALVRGSTDTWLDNTLRTSQNLGDVPVI